MYIKNILRLNFRGLIRLFIFISLVLIGCEQQPTEVEKYRFQPILTGFLFNGEPVEEVFLERVAPLGSYYEAEHYGITRADIVINGGGEILRMTDDPAKRGRYIPVRGQSLIPKGKTRYRIEARTTNGEFLRAETVVPDTFGWMSIYLMQFDGTRIPVNDGDTLSRSDRNMIWEWPLVDSAGGYSGMGVTLVPRDSLVPLDPSWDPAKDSLEDSDRDRIGWTIMRDDQTRLTLPWIYFTWEGPHRLTLMAISRDYYDYLFTSFRVQQGLIEFPQTNVKGGLGIFSGLSRRSITVVMKKSL